MRVHSLLQIGALFKCSKLQLTCRRSQKVTESQIQARHTVIRNKANTTRVVQATAQTNLTSVILTDWPDQSLAEKCKPSKGPVLGLTNEARHAFRQSQRPTNSNQNCQAYLQPLGRLMTSQPNTNIHSDLTPKIVQFLYICHCNDEPRLQCEFAIMHQSLGWTN